ncbi:hypothetical protein [Cupriavidus campinensis]
MIVLLAFLPLQVWAGTSTPAAFAETSLAMPAADAMQADVGAPGDADLPAPADSADPSPPGADLAEPLLPAPMPRVAAPRVRGTVPRYAGNALPDPDLPRLPRPPRG